MELSIGKSVTNIVCPVYGQGGFSDSCGADNDQHPNGMVVFGHVRQYFAESARFGGSADEATHVTGQLPGHLAGFMRYLMGASGVGAVLGGLVADGYGLFAPLFVAALVQLAAAVVVWIFRTDGSGAAEEDCTSRCCAGPAALRTAPTETSSSDEQPPTIAAAANKAAHTRKPASPGTLRRVARVSRTRMVAGGGRSVEVDPERVAGWFERFSERHEGVRRTVLSPATALVEAADGATAEVPVPFPPLTGEPCEHIGLEITVLVEHLLVPRRIGLVLVRRGGHSVGIAEGGAVSTSRTGRRHVQGRSAAGGWSQQRFARRRQGQARQALAAAAEDAAEVLGPRVSELDAVVLGGDRGALDVLRADRRLDAIMALARPGVLDVGEPRRSVLDEAARRARAVQIVVREPE